MGSVIPSASDRRITSALPTSVKRFCFADTGAFLATITFVNRGTFPKTDLMKLANKPPSGPEKVPFSCGSERSEEPAQIGRDALLARGTVTCITACWGDRLHVGYG